MSRSLPEERIGFPEQKLELKPDATRETRLRRNRNLLARSLNLGTTVAFVGAGCSAPLGYLTWTGFVETLVKQTRDTLLKTKDGADAGGDEDLTHLDRLLDKISTNELDKLLYPFILGTCRKIFFRARASGESDYYDFLKSTFERPDPDLLKRMAAGRAAPGDEDNPYMHLLKLPITRFITSNYDGELENALNKYRGIPAAELKLKRSPATRDVRQRVFTQKPDYYEHLALFALARVRAAENLVFHCHGHYEEPESMIVTESDYQEWYLTERPGAEAFRQTTDLLFSSNPILFVGYGIGDDDLLRPLRMLAAVRQRGNETRPLFALMPEISDGHDEDYHQFLFERYGVNVIPYESPFEERRGEDLINQLKELRRSWGEWWDGWLEKPKIRTVEVVAEPSYLYHFYPQVEFKKEDSLYFGRRRIKLLLTELKKEASKSSTRVIALIGPGGTGKSWLANELRKSLESDQKFEAYFFWSSYYANDSLTGLDRLLRYLDRDNKVQGSRLERLAKCLDDRRCFIVFDGIERFLRESENPEEGVGFSPNATELLNTMLMNGRSVVVITSRLFPSDFGGENVNPDDSKRGNEPVQRFRIQPFITSDIEQVEPFLCLANHNEVSAICSLLDGHIYGLTLVANILKQVGACDDEEEKRERVLGRLKEIEHALSGTPPDRRISRMIRESIQELDGTRWNGLALKLLERMAIFMSRMDDRTVEVCFRLAVESAGAATGGPLDGRREELVADLVSANLLQKVWNMRQAKARGPHKEARSAAYTMHDLVRAHIFHRIHQSSTDILPDFTLPGFTVGTAVVDPGSTVGVEVVSKLFESLHEASDEARIRWSRARAANDKKTERESLEESVALCRSAFGVIRSRMLAITAPRWSSYKEYFRYILRVAQLAKNTSPGVWSYAERRQVRDVEDEYGPLYAEELSWVYNEIGLTSYGEGVMLDALAAWEQGYEINKVIDSNQEGGNYLFQSQCNLGAAYIHYGRLDIAYRYLREAQRTNYRLNDRDHGGRIKGYLALVQHLRGDLKGAKSLYDEAQKDFDAVGGNIRAESIFRRHQGDLMIRLDDEKEAGLLIHSSRSLAEAGRYPELVAYARLSNGHLLRSQKEYQKALREYNAALVEARRIGISRLESETLSELSQLAYDLGDAEIARQRAIEALRIANGSVLGLRQTHCLVVLGKATIQSGRRELGIAYLKHASGLAKQQEYWLRGSEAEELLQQYEDPSAKTEFKPDARA